MNEQTIESVDNTLNIVNIKWNVNHIINNKVKSKDLNNLPEMFSIDIPQNIRLIEEKDEQQYKDAIETFTYNFLTKKFGVEVSDCQIYLPLK